MKRERNDCKYLRNKIGLCKDNNTIRFTPKCLLL